MSIEAIGDSGHGSGHHCVDLLLPARLPLGELLPAIVEAVFGDTAFAGVAGVRRWYLTRLAGSALDSSQSLRDNGVRDGDVMLLAPRPLPVPQLGSADTAAVTARCCPTGNSRAVFAAAASGIAMSAALLLWSGTGAAGSTSPWSALGLSAGAAAGSVVAGRGDPPAARLLGVAAVLFASAAGVLAVRGAPWPAVALLTASAALAMSLLLVTLTGDITMAATAATSGAVALVSAVAVAAPIDIAPNAVAAGGAALAVLSAAALSVAPRIAILTHRLGPPRRDVDERLPAAAHRTLTALVCGWCCSAILGITAIALATIASAEPVLVRAALCADLALVMLLRTRSHADPARGQWLTATGAVSACAAALLLVVGAPAYAEWLCAAAATVCVIAVWATGSEREPNPGVRQGIQIAEYAALAAVVPLACWVFGLYSAVRGLIPW